MLLYLVPLFVRVADDAHKLQSFAVAGSHKIDDVTQILRICSLVWVRQTVRQTNTVFESNKEGARAMYSRCLYDEFVRKRHSGIAMSSYFVEPAPK